MDAVHVCTPNVLHFPIVKDALEAGKHVICEKPLATSAEEAKKLVALAAKPSGATAPSTICASIPMVQQMRRMREDGDLGDILVVQGTYSQDWLLYDTDYNWRLDSKDNGPSRCLADIGSHLCDMAEHVTGPRITSLCADLQTFHKTRKQAQGPHRDLRRQDADAQKTTPNTQSIRRISARVVFRMGERTRGAFTASQVSAGRKNRLSIEIYGSEGRRGLGPGAARRTVDRPAQHATTRSSSKTRRC